MTEHKDFLMNVRKETDDQLIYVVGVVAKRHFAKMQALKRLIEAERRIVDFYVRRLDHYDEVNAINQERIAALTEIVENMKPTDKTDKKEMH